MQFLHKSFEKSKQNYFGKIDMKHLNGNRMFWKTRSFLDKGINSHKMMIIEKDKLSSQEMSITVFMNNYFVNISESLNWKDSSESNMLNIGSNMHLFKNVAFDNHVSVKIIRGKKRVMESSASNQSQLKGPNDNYRPRLQ